MSYIQITGSTYINPKNIISVNIETRTETRIENEYKDNAKFHYIESYELIIKMINGDTYKEVFNEIEKAQERRYNLTAHW